MTIKNDFSTKMKQPITILNLPVRVNNSLLNAGIITILNLVELDEPTLSKMFGRTAFNGVINSLTQHGLHLGIAELNRHLLDDNITPITPPPTPEQLTTAAPTMLRALKVAELTLVQLGCDDPRLFSPQLVEIRAAIASAEQVNDGQVPT